MKKGDKVHLLGREEVTGHIIDVRYEHLGGIDYTQYKVKYDNTNLCPQEDWHEELHLVSIEDLPIGYFNGIKCECGVDSVMKNGKHSTYCPLYWRNGD